MRARVERAGSLVRPSFATCTSHQRCTIAARSSASSSSLSSESPACGRSAFPMPARCRPACPAGSTHANAVQRSVCSVPSARAMVDDESDAASPGSAGRRTPGRWLRGNGGRRTWSWSDAASDRARRLPAALVRDEGEWRGERAGLALMMRGEADWRGEVAGLAARATEASSTRCCEASRARCDVRRARWLCASCASRLRALEPSFVFPCRRSSSLDVRTSSASRRARGPCFIGSLSQSAQAALICFAAFRCRRSSRARGHELVSSVDELRPLASCGCASVR